MDAFECLVEIFVVAEHRCCCWALHTRNRCSVSLSVEVRAQKWRPREFDHTLVLIVMTIIAMIAIPSCQKSRTRSKEFRLKNALFTIRTVCDEYIFDKKRAPQTLQDLVGEGYLGSVPIDPITGSNQTWVVVMEDSQNAVDKTRPGIRDVRSGSNGKSLEGTPLSQW
jgi:general secretion pathway protein G